MDRKLFYLIYNKVGKSTFLTKLTVLLTKYVSKVYAFVYIAGGIYLFFNDRAKLSAYVAVPFFVLCLTLILREMIGRRRPFAALGVEPRIKHEDNGSFPSNHSASSMIIAISLFNINAVLGIVFVILSVLTGASRIAAGVHYPLDVFAGWFIAVAVFGVLFAVGSVY